MNLIMVLSTSFLLSNPGSFFSELESMVLVSTYVSTPSVRKTPSHWTKESHGSRSSVRPR